MNCTQRTVMTGTTIILITVSNMQKSGAGEIRKKHKDTQESGVLSIPITMRNTEKRNDENYANTGGSISAKNAWKSNLEGEPPRPDGVVCKCLSHGD